MAPAQVNAEVDESGRRGDVVVVGAGLVGAMTALLLGRAGYSVKVFELRPGKCAKLDGISWQYAEPTCKHEPVVQNHADLP